jgi:hypothetical protein
MPLSKPVRTFFTSSRAREARRADAVRPDLGQAPRAGALTPSMAHLQAVTSGP